MISLKESGVNLLGLCQISEGKVRFLIKRNWKGVNVSTPIEEILNDFQSFGLIVIEKYIQDDHVPDHGTEYFLVECSTELAPSLRRQQGYKVTFMDFTSHIVYEANKALNESKWRTPPLEYSYNDNLYQNWILS